MIRYLLELILCFGTAFIANCHAQDQECYTGSLVDADFDFKQLKSVKCSNNVTPEIQGGHVGAGDSKLNLTQVKITHCVAQTHDGKDQQNIYPVEFRCDYDRVCGEGSTSVKGQNDTTYCCKQSLCNSPSLVGLPVVGLQCYVGTLTNNDTSLISIQCGTQQCLSNRLYETIRSGVSAKGMTFQCDEENICQQNNLINSCKNVSIGSGLQEICCCTTPNCNTPKYVINDKQPMGTLPPGQPREGTHSNWMYIGSVVSATAVAVLVIAGLVIVIKKCQQRKDEHVRYIYSQLTADLSEEIDDDDAYMIVA